VAVIGEIESDAARVCTAEQRASRFPTAKLNIEAHSYRDGDAYELAISCLLPDSLPGESSVGLVPIR
jgi:hypothetical protein